MKGGANGESSGETSPVAWISPSYFSVAPLIDTEEGEVSDKPISPWTKVDQQDAWLPITESRNGNQYSAAFHIFVSGFGFPVLMLPVAFTYLGWVWGMVSLSLIFGWQLYTIWVLVQLHESSTLSGIRYSRYLHLICSAFGKKWGMLLAAPGIVFLSAGTCLVSVIVGGSALKALFQVSCGSSCSAKLTTVEWYVVFTSAAVLLSQLPNLNSMAALSLLGSTMAIGYCTFVGYVSVDKGRLPVVSYHPLKERASLDQAFNVLKALGIIALTFRGHNLILEIQGTMPSSWRHPPRVPMWKGAMTAYTVIAVCLYPLVIAAYWAYGDKISEDTGLLGALYAFHFRDLTRFMIRLINFFLLGNALASFQIYAMPGFDCLESLYTRRKHRPCPWWLRASARALFGYSIFFGAVAAPVSGNIAGLAGGSALPISLAYPCFAWITLKKPKTYTAMWWLNWGLGILGMVLSALVMAAGLHDLIKNGADLHFFRPGSHP